MVFVSEPGEICSAYPYGLIFRRPKFEVRYKTNKEGDLVLLSIEAWTHILRLVPISQTSVQLINLLGEINPKIKKYNIQS